MSRNLLLTTLFITVLIGTLGLSFEVQRADASGTIFIRADGSIDPQTPLVTTADNVTYTLTGNITSDSDGIVVERSNIIIEGDGYTLQGAGSGYGFYWYDINNVTIENTNIQNFNYGICPFSSSSSSISGNNITNNFYGIWLGDSSGNSIFGNKVTNNGYGIELSDSPNNVFRSNSIDDNEYNFGVSATSFPTSAFINDVDESNIINGKPIYYWVNRQNDKVPADAGYIALVNSENIAVEDLNLTRNVQGILIAYSANITVQRNLITENADGIHLAWSSNSHIIRNNITENTNAGVYLWPWSSSNIIAESNITNNWRGISLSSSSNNTVSGNSITNNGYGIKLFDSSGNTIHHNNFINNTNYQASATMGSYNTIWDDGYPSGGNYWSDYNGTDANHDGIGDTPYVIDANNKDNYPLMSNYVIPEFPSLFILPLFFIATLLAVIAYRGRHSNKWDGARSPVLSDSSQGFIRDAKLMIGDSV